MKSFSFLKNVFLNLPSKNDIYRPPLLKKLINKATPSETGLYPYEILMLNYAAKYKTSQKSFPKFWYHTYQVDDPKRVLNSLYLRGYIEEASVEKSISKLTVQEIKNELKLTNNKTTGKKSELVDRLLSSASAEYLNSKFKDRYYQLTQKGEKELQDNEYIIYANEKSIMDIWEINYKINNEYKGRSYRDIIWIDFEERSKKAIQEKAFFTYQEIRHSMSVFLIDENKLKSALNLLCEASLYKLNSVEDNQIDMKEIYHDDFLSNMYLENLEKNSKYEDSWVKLYPYTEDFIFLKDKLNLTDVEFIKLIYDFIKNVTLPYRTFNNDECIQIIVAEVHGNKDKLNKIYSTAYKRKKDEFFINKYMT